MYFALSSDVLIYSTKSISACEVDILVRNPYWLVDSILFLSMNLSTLLFIFFQEFLLNWHSGDICLYLLNSTFEPLLNIGKKIKLSSYLEKFHFQRTY